MTKANIIELITHLVSKETGIPKSEIKGTEAFYELGLDSINSVFLLDELEKSTGLELNPIFFWDYPTLDSFSAFIEKELLKS